VESDFRQICNALDKDLGKGNWVRKDFALLATSKEWTQYPGLVFSLFDGREIDGNIWDMIRPRGDDLA